MPQKRLVVELTLENDPMDWYDGYSWNRKYKILVNEIPKDDRLSLAESWAQSDSAWEDFPNLFVTAVEKDADPDTVLDIG